MRFPSKGTWTHKPPREIIEIINHEYLVDKLGGHSSYISNTVSPEFNLIARDCNNVNYIQEFQRKIHKVYGEWAAVQWEPNADGRRYCVFDRVTGVIYWGADLYPEK